MLQNKNIFKSIGIVQYTLKRFKEWTRQHKAKPTFCYKKIDTRQPFDDVNEYFDLKVES